MEGVCASCQQVQRKFYCTECLRTHLREYKSSTQRAAAERDAELVKVTKSLASIQSGRLLRADQARLEDSIHEIVKETQSAQARMEEARHRLAAKRAQVASRRSNLQQARHLLSTADTATSSQSTIPTLKSQIRGAMGRASSTDTSLAATRKVLIKSLVEAFDLREAVAPDVTPAMPSAGDYVLPFAVSSASFISGAGKALFGRSGVSMSMLGQSLLSDAGTSGNNKRPAPGKGEWSIAGLVLPVPGDLRRYPADHITAAITHTLHFLRLLTFYLGIKLPFEVFWSGGLPGVGQPSIAAAPGNARLNWESKWTDPYPLYLTSSDPSDSTTTLSSIAKPSLESFKTALCMLNYNIAYLSHTQGLDIPLSLTGETLRNLWSICCLTADGLARSSHSSPSLTHPLAPPNSSPSFKLELAQLLQIASPASATGNVTASSSSRSKQRRSSKTGDGRRRAGDIADEWNLVEIDEGDEGVG